MFEGYGVSLFIYFLVHAHCGVFIMEKVQRVFPVEKFNVGALMLYGVFLPGEGLLNRL